MAYEYKVYDRVQSTIHSMYWDDAYISHVIDGRPYMKFLSIKYDSFGICMEDDEIRYIGQLSTLEKVLYNLSD